MLNKQDLFSSISLEDEVSHPLCSSQKKQPVTKPMNDTDRKCTDGSCNSPGERLHMNARLILNITCSFPYTDGFKADAQEDCGDLEGVVAYRIHYINISWSETAQQVFPSISILTRNCEECQGSVIQYIH